MKKKIVIIPRILEDIKDEMNYNLGLDGSENLDLERVKELKHDLYYQALCLISNEKFSKEKQKAIAYFALDTND